MAVDYDRTESHMNEGEKKGTSQTARRRLEGGGNIPSLRKDCQNENDRKNEAELDKTRRRKEGQRKSERKER